MSALVVIFIITLAGSINIFADAKFPENPKPCKYEDTECIKRVINYLLQENSEGESSLNLVKIDPLAPSKFSIKQGVESPVNIDLKLSNNLIHGFKNGIASEVRGFGKDLTQKHEIHLKFKTVTLNSDYSISGKVLILPISGTGKSNITFVNSDMRMQFSGTPKEKNGETYMKIDHLKIDLVPERLMYDFSNLFDGDQVLADDIKLCKFQDSDCLLKSIQHALETYADTGIRQLNIPPFAPLRINSLKLARNPQSPVSVELKFSDVDINGLQDAKLIKINGFDADLKKNIELKTMVPKITLKGTYSIDGSVLFVPIIGKGNSEIILHDLVIASKLHPKAVQKDGNTYLKVNAFKLKLSPKRVTFYMENLFNGDKTLSQYMTTFINENWADIFSELEPDFSLALGEIMVHIVNEAFSVKPYEEYFLK